MLKLLQSTLCLITLYFFPLNKLIKVPSILKIYLYIQAMTEYNMNTWDEHKKSVSWIRATCKVDPITPKYAKYLIM